MQIIKKASWQEVYESWKKDEENIWQEHFTREGYNNWDHFREEQIKDLKNLDWELHKITAQDLQTMECGDFKHWNQLAEKEGTRLLKTLSQVEHFQNHPKIEALKKDFPTKIYLIAMGSTLIEGHHRVVTLIQNPQIQTEIFLYQNL